MHQDARRSIRQNMPNLIPVMVLSRLVVDTLARGMKLGAALLKDALQRCVMVSREYEAYLSIPLRPCSPVL